MAAKSVALVGATGAVGRTMLAILSDRDFEVSTLRMFASKRSAGSVVATKWGDVVVEDLAAAEFSGVDIALFSAGGDRSRQFAADFVECGAVVIDNSSAFRMDPDVPLVVVDVNSSAIGNHRGIVANPNCTTMTLMMAAGPLHDAFGLQSVVVSSYQAVSGSGQRGGDELLDQIDGFRSDVSGLMTGTWEEPISEVYNRPIGFNALPLAGNFVEDGYTDEEMKLVNESRKILSHPDLRVEPTCVRVPVMVGHGVSANLRFSGPIAAEDAIEVLRRAPGVDVWSDKVPTALDSAGIDDVLVGRIRPTIGEPGGVNLWAVGDNLRKGAALNAVQIAELL
ncbi:MAG TPA: aspartate-semialdehyde dehydrogenase [Acidimicrobiia bacterium]